MPRMRWRPGFRPGPAEGAHDALPDPLVGWGPKNSTPSAPSAPRSFALALAARRFGASFLAYSYPPIFLAVHWEQGRQLAKAGPAKNNSFARV